MSSRLFSAICTFKVSSPHGISLIYRISIIKLSFFNFSIIETIVQKIIKYCVRHTKVMRSLFELNKTKKNFKISPLDDDFCKSHIYSMFSLVNKIITTRHVQNDVHRFQLPFVNRKRACFTVCWPQCVRENAENREMLHIRWGKILGLWKLIRYYKCPQTQQSHKLWFRYWDTHTLEKWRWWQTKKYWLKYR